MIGTSKRELATRALYRLEGFNANDAALADALRKVDIAERGLHAETTALQDTFVELIQRALSRPGAREGNVDALQLEALRDRIAKIEDGYVNVRAAQTVDSKGKGKAEQIDSPTPPPPSQPAPPPPPSPPLEVEVNNDVEMAVAVEDDDTPAPESKSPGSKRGRARALLESVLDRLEAVEDQVANVINQVDDFENMVADRDIETAEMVERYEEMATEATAVAKQYKSILAKREARYCRNAGELVVRPESSSGAASALGLTTDTAASAAPPGTASPVQSTVADGSTMSPSTPGTGSLAQRAINTINELKSNVSKLQEDVQEIRNGLAHNSSALVTASNGAPPAATHDDFEARISGHFTGQLEVMKKEMFTALGDTIGKQVRQLLDKERTSMLNAVHASVNQLLEHERPKLRQDVIAAITASASASAQRTPGSSTSSPSINSPDAPFVPTYAQQLFASSLSSEQLQTYNGLNDNAKRNLHDMDPVKQKLTLDNLHQYSQQKRQQQPQQPQATFQQNQMSLPNTNVTSWDQMVGGSGTPGSTTPGNQTLLTPQQLALAQQQAPHEAEELAAQEELRLKWQQQQERAQAQAQTQTQWFSPPQ